MGNQNTGTQAVLETAKQQARAKSVRQLARSGNNADLPMFARTRRNSVTKRTQPILDRQYLSQIPVILPPKIQRNRVQLKQQEWLQILKEEKFKQRKNMQDRKLRELGDRVIHKQSWDRRFWPIEQQKITKVAMQIVKEAIVN